MVSKTTPKVLVIGLDCAPPKLLFEDFKGSLPNISRLIDEGSFSNLRSIYPPITIPAWMSMVSGKDAGQMGVYGFRTREKNSYNDFDISTSSAFSHVDKIWDILGRHKKKSIVVGVPPSYPPYPINGHMVSGFICPDSTYDFTYPKELKKEIQSLVGDYSFDVLFRTEDRQSLIENAWKMTEERFEVIEYLMKNKEWDFFMFVEIGVDRIQHAFWKYYDKTHHLYEPGHKYKDVILNYYRLIDERIGRLFQIIDKNTTVFVVSDHGAKPMKGSFCINEWFIQKGYLVLNEYPKNITKISECDINWKKTKAWGWGGYYARIFINKSGRESQGIVEESAYERLRDKIIKELKGEKDKFGESWDTKIYRPEELYRNAGGNPPDLMAFFDDLAYRSAGTIGYNQRPGTGGKLFLDENDTGPDDAMHDWNGVFIQYNPQCKGKGRVDTIQLSDFPSFVYKAMKIKQ